MIAERQADAVWTGDVARGTGTVTLASSGAAGPLPVSLPARTQAPDGRTSPEELLAAAHAGCYAMALAHVLTQAGTPPGRLEVSVRVALDHVGEGFGITASRLTVRGEVPGLGHWGFRAAAEAAERSCPVSAALRGRAEVVLDAELPARTA